MLASHLPILAPLTTVNFYRRTRTAQRTPEENASEIMEHAPRLLNVFTTIIICALCTLGSADEEFPARSIQFVEKYAGVTSYKHDWYGPSNKAVA